MPYVRLIHGILFCATLQLACFVSWILCLTVGSILNVQTLTYAGKPMKVEDVMSILTIILTWIIALVLFIKSVLKRRNKHKRLLSLAQSGVNYESIADDNLQDSEDSLNSFRLQSEITLETEPQLATVFCLTLSGALDEMLCFPSFMLARMFSYPELAVGSLLACLTIITVLTLFLSTCKPLLDALDKIPLFVIVAGYAIILTVSHAMRQQQH